MVAAEKGKGAAEDGGEAAADGAAAPQQVGLCDLWGQGCHAVKGCHAAGMPPGAVGPCVRCHTCLPSVPQRPNPTPLRLHLVQVGEAAVQEDLNSCPICLDDLSTRTITVSPHGRAAAECGMHGFSAKNAAA